MERIASGKHLTVDVQLRRRAVMQDDRVANRFKVFTVVAMAIVGLLPAPVAAALATSDHALRVSSYIGGTEVDIAQAVAIDDAGALYVTGYTLSPNFPTTEGAFQRRLSEGAGTIYYDVFVTKIDPSGSRIEYSTYLGGTDMDMPAAIDVDSDGNAYVTGVTRSADWPTTSGAINNLTRSAENAFVTKLSADGSSLEYSALLGPGSAGGIEVDGNGEAYVDGETSSSNYPTTPGAAQPDPNGNGDVFISKITSDGSDFVYSTFLGGSEGELRPGGVRVDDAGAAVVAGTTSSDDFPTSVNAFQSQPGDDDDFLPDAFVTKLSPEGTAFVYSTYLGGDDFEYNATVDVDSDGAAYVAGSTNSTDFPTTPGAFQRTKQSNRRGTDAFVVKFDPQGSLLFGTYVGGLRADDATGIRVGPKGAAYIGGTTKSRNFPTTKGALKRRQGANVDAFLTRVNPRGTGLDYSTLYGGWAHYENGYGIDVAGGRIALVGPTYGPELPLAGTPFQPELAGSAEGYVAEFSVTRAVNSDIGDGRFDDDKQKLALGDTVQWHFTSKGKQSVRDRSGLDLFDSGVKSAEFHYAFTFFSAGRFLARHSPSSDRQRISIPLEATRSTEDIELRWATEGRAGYVFDVQVKEPGADSFETLYDGTESLEATYDPQTQGQYSFRSRIRRSDTGAHSGWSPAISV
jgi:plastocyanin